jgi:hypothetical protein
MRDRTRARDCGLPRAAALSFAVYTRAVRRKDRRRVALRRRAALRSVALRQEVPIAANALSPSPCPLAL